MKDPKKTNYVELFTVSSGYRNKDTKELTLTTNYDQFKEIATKEFGESALDNFKVIIKQDEIITAQPHDPEVYAKIQQEKNSNDTSEGLVSKLKRMLLG